jgi:uncharacterized protein (DUF2237 family)
MNRNEQSGPSLNVPGEFLQICGRQSVAGFFRDGSCSIALQGMCATADRVVQGVPHQTSLITIALKT